MKNAQRGFTLIELVIVITIVGILAAVAMPRFVNLQADARAAKVKAIYGAIKSAAALAKARCELDLVQGVAGSCTSTGGTILMDGATIDMVNRYPAASATGIDRATQLDNPDNEGIVAAGSGPRVYQMNGATTPSTCQVEYTAPAAVNVAPTIEMKFAGC